MLPMAMSLLNMPHYPIHEARTLKEIYWRTPQLEENEVVVRREWPNKSSLEAFG